MKTEELKNQLIENYKGMTQTQEELNVINENIIKHQKEHIALLEEHIVELRQIIEKFLLKPTSDDRDNNSN
jgi:hypothetical protein